MFPSTTTINSIRNRLVSLLKSCKDYLFYHRRHRSTTNSETTTTRFFSYTSPRHPHSRVHSLSRISRSIMFHFYWKQEINLEINGTAVDERTKSKVNQI